VPSVTSAGRGPPGSGAGEGWAGAGPGRGVAAGPAMADPEEERPGLDPEDAGEMDPDHPLLARAQAALKAQIVAARENVEAQLREKHESLRVRGLFLGMPPPAPSPASRSRPPPPPLPPRAARRGGRPWWGRALAFPA